MRKLKIIFASLLVLALLFSVPLGSSVASDDECDECNYLPGAAEQYGLTGEYITDPYVSPVVMYFDFYDIDDILAFEVRARRASMIDVHVVDCCSHGDWWRADIVSTTRRNEVADSTHSTQSTDMLYPVPPNDPRWSPAALATKTPPGTMKAIITVTSGIDAHPGFPAGMWIKFTTDGTSLEIEQIPQEGEKYALLICGDTPYSAYQAYLDGTGAWNGGLEEGADYGPSYAGFDEFWNDTYRMYDILVNKAGFKPWNVLVLWGDGTDWSVSHPTEVCDKYTPGGTITLAAATISNVQTVFTGLAGMMTENDSLFVWTFDHGATGPGRDSRTRGDSYLCLMDGVISDVDFATYLNAIPYKRRTIVMQQCYSGGFIDDLTRGSDGRKTAIYTACRGDEYAWEADDVNPSPDGAENENCWDTDSGSSIIAHHGEFNYYFMNALEWLSTLGTAVDADANGDGTASSYEAFQWALANDSRPESPQYKDRRKIGWSWIVTNE